MERTIFFADVTLPLKLNSYYTYRIPFSQNHTIAVGMRVIVQFGAKKYYAALVRRIHSNPPEATHIKYILGTLDQTPIITEKQFLLWEWMAEYYMCSVGQVMSAALPSVFRLTSEELFVIHPDFDGNTAELSEIDQKILQEFHLDTPVSLSELSKLIAEENLFPIIKSLVERNILLPQEELNDRYSPKKETHLTLSATYNSEEKIQKLFASLEASPQTEKQLNVLLRFFHLKAQSLNQDVRKHDILKDPQLSYSALQTLIKKGVFEPQQKIVSRLLTYTATTSAESLMLNSEQREAFTKITQDWETKTTALLHGVTGSGKTALYIKWIDQTIREGKQVLYLLPEISLTAQIINRLRFYFGNKVGIYHSRYNDQERGEVWTRVLQTNHENSYQIILGARSAVFLPFTNLGLVIVDEEHETSYKQQDLAPHYNARDTAIYLAHSQQAKVLLGSATPSIESYFNAVKVKKYGFATLKQRYSGILMPEILCADLKEDARKKELKANFSPLLLQTIENALKAKEQVILFQNRRGFSTRIECQHCHDVPHCINCDVSLTYHKTNGMLTCHYCGYAIPIAEYCPICKHGNFALKGFGTERIEEDLEVVFPNARIARMDLDSTRSKNAYTQIIQDFEERKIDILTGTQMVSKGLDFDNVGVVGILSADDLIHFPDFRSFEKSFQQMMQVSGRAGRRNKRGIVIIQSYNPWHEAIRNVMDYDYEKMFENQIVERNLFRYPPFFRLIKILIKHRQREDASKAAQYLSQQLRQTFPHVLGPQQPLIGRVRNNYLEEIILKIPRNTTLKKNKETIQELVIALYKHPDFRTIKVDIDIDPI